MCSAFSNMQLHFFYQSDKIWYVCGLTKVYLLFKCWERTCRTSWVWFLDKGVARNEQMLSTIVVWKCLYGWGELPLLMKEKVQSYRSNTHSFYAICFVNLDWNTQSLLFHCWPPWVGVTPRRWSIKISHNPCYWGIWNSDVSIKIWFVASDD